VLSLVTAVDDVLLQWETESLETPDDDEFEDSTSTALRDAMAVAINGLASKTSTSGSVCYTSCTLSLGSGSNLCRRV
jgi:hypothetical protein